MSGEVLTTFVLASALLALAPGPDNIFVLTQAALHGRNAGLLVTLGLCTGLIVHTTLVAFGVAAIFLVSTTAFVVLKLAGAAWLVWLAVQAWRASTTLQSAEVPRALTAAQLYRRGIVMNLTNPKVAIFFLAFLPQFARPEAGSVPLQLFVFGGIFIVVALLIFSLVALLAGHLAAWFTQSRHAQAMLNKAAALVFVGLATRLALTSR